jgi:hypothetical protein
MLIDLNKLFETVEKAEQGITFDVFLDTLVKALFEQWREKTTISKVLMKYAPKIINFNFLLLVIK